MDTQVKYLEEGDKDDIVWVRSFDRGICTYVRVTLCTPKKGRHFPSFFRFFGTRWHPPLTNLITHPLCFLAAFCSDVTSQLFSWKGGGASDVKKPRPLLLHCLKKYRPLKVVREETTLKKIWHKLHQNWCDSS